MKARILLIEDEKDIRDFMALNLKREGYEIIEAADGEDGLRKIETEGVDLAVVDWMVPGMTGLDVCRKVNGKVPVLMVTARTDPADIVLGLEAGADDYLAKPFELPVLRARVNALLRRRERTSGTPSKRGAFKMGDVSVDVGAHRVSVAGGEIQLTATEFKVLVALLENQGRVLSRAHLIQLVQGDGVTVSDRTIDTHVFGLRKKLGPSADIIETIRGVGYRVDHQ